MINVGMNYMYHALQLARQAVQHGDVPVGAILVANDHIIAQTHNQCMADHNSLHHAEMLAIHQGMTYLQCPYLNDCTLYVTLEPCPMCAAALAQARISKLVFGAYDPKSGGVEHGSKIFEYSHHQPEIIGGVLEQECSDLLINFFKEKR